MKKLMKIWKLTKDNKRYFWVLTVFALIFWINNAFPSDTITSENCSDGQCEKLILKPQLSDEEMKLYKNDVLSSIDGEFFRLIFQTETNQDSEIEVFATNPLDQEKLIQEIKLKENTDRKNYEIIFQADQKYTDLLFSKKNTDGSEILIKNIRITKLNIKNEKELGLIQSTILGYFDIKDTNQEQLKNDFVFERLKELNIIFGQIFKAENDFIAGIEMDINIIKQKNGTGDRYHLELREANFNGNTPEITNNKISTLKFSTQTIEEYRQPNGKFYFPIMAPVKQGRYYFIGFDNDGIELNQFNYLAPRGTSTDTTHPNRTMAVKFKGESFPSQGSFYFKIFGANFNKINDKKIPLGSTIEDLGNKNGLYKFQLDESQFNLLDFSESTPDIKIDLDNNSIIGNTNEKTTSEAIYKFETIHPFKTFRILAEKINSTDKETQISYSFDKESWINIPREIIKKDEATTTFNFSKTEQVAKEIIYIKISPQNTWREKGKYGVKNFRFEADLITK